MAALAISSSGLAWRAQRCWSSSGRKLTGFDAGYGSSARRPSSVAIEARKKRIKAKDLSKQREFEDGMMVWDDVFEMSCEDPAKAAKIVAVAEKGLAKYGRGCVLIRQTTASMKRGAGTGFVNRSRPLMKTSKPSFYRSFDWSVSYIPRSFILDPTLAPADQLENGGTKLAQVNSWELQHDNESDIVASCTEEQRDENNCTAYDDQKLLVHQMDLMPVLRGMDRTRVLSLTVERVVKDSISSKAMQDVEHQDAGGEEPYKPESGELVLLLSVEFDGSPVVGADVVRASQKNSKWKLELRDIAMFL